MEAKVTRNGVLHLQIVRQRDEALGVQEVRITYG